MKSFFNLRTPNCTVLVLDLGRAGEDAVGHLHSAPWTVVWPVQLAVLAQLGQDLGRLLRVPPYVVTMATKRVIIIIYLFLEHCDTQQQASK